MKVATQDSHIRRRSSAYIWVLHVPYLNYLFFFFQIKGVYGMFRNFYENRQKLPNLLHGIFMVFKYALYGTIGSGIILVILMYFNLNPFGKMFLWYLNIFNDIFSGYLPYSIAKYVTFIVPDHLTDIRIHRDIITTNLLVIFSTYFINGILAMILAYVNIREDQNRFARY